jgi:hypothetical protein
MRAIRRIGRWATAPAAPHVTPDEILERMAIIRPSKMPRPEYAPPARPIYLSPEDVAEHMARERRIRTIRHQALPNVET